VRHDARHGHPRHKLNSRRRMSSPLWQQSQPITVAVALETALPRSPNGRRVWILWRRGGTSTAERPDGSRQGEPGGGRRSKKCQRTKPLAVGAAPGPHHPSPELLRLKSGRYGRSFATNRNSPGAMRETCCF
jgi:hypothetical protein